MWAGVVGIVGFCAEMALVLGPTDLVDGLHLPYTAPPWVGTVLVVSSATLLFVAVVGGLVGAFIRMLRARAPERQQLLWLLAALVPYVAGYFGTIVQTELAYAFFGVAVAVGVLRYRLLDIHLVVRRALFYVPLIAVVASRWPRSRRRWRGWPRADPCHSWCRRGVAVLVGPVSGWLRRTVGPVRAR